MPFRDQGALPDRFPLFEGNGGRYDEPQIRRTRLGFEAKLAKNVELHVVADLDLSCEDAEDCTDDAYEGLTDGYLAWRPSDALELAVGKVSVPFTLDGSTSSNSLLTLERSNLANNLWFPAE